MIFFSFFRSFNLLLRDSAEGSQFIDESKAGEKGATPSLKMEQQDLGVVSMELRPESPIISRGVWSGEEPHPEPTHWGNGGVVMT